MNEKLENELKQWEENYKKEKQKLLEKFPFIENTLSNQHPINQLQKEFWNKKIEIYKKYNKLDSTQK